MKHYCVYVKLLLLLLVVGLARNTVCTTLGQIMRHLPKNTEIVQQQAWKTPTVSQSAKDDGASQLTHASNLDPQAQSYYQLKFDERISDHIAEHVLRFAHNVGQQLLLANTPNGKSEVFSPLSVMSALAQLMLGAKGRSYQELSQLLGLDYDAELSQNPSKFHVELGFMLEDLQRLSVGSMRARENTRWRKTTTANNIRNPATAESGKTVEHIIKVANGIFTQAGYSLNPDYRYTIRTVYQSEVTQLDFHQRSQEARDYINHWVERNTFGKIPNILNDDIPRETNVILASALYFKGFWENAFFEAATITDNFYPNGLKQPPVKVKMMATGGVLPYYNSAEYDCRIIGLPYKGNLTTMYVIQPNDSTRAKLKELHQQLDAAKIEELISKMVRKTAVLAFPKMHIIRSVNMRDTLQRLGIREIFGNGISDLSLLGATEYRYPPAPQQIKFSQPQFLPKDRYNEPALIVRFGAIGGPVEAETQNTSAWVDPLAEPAVGSKRRREAQAEPLFNRETVKSQHLERLERERQNTAYGKSDLYVGDILHKVDFDVNEHGTEAAAATLTYLRRSGTDVLFRAETPFMLLIRHDPTKLVLFYGIVNEPEL